MLALNDGTKESPWETDFSVNEGKILSLEPSSTSPDSIYGIQHHATYRQTADDYVSGYHLVLNIRPNENPSAFENTLIELAAGYGDLEDYLGTLHAGIVRLVEGIEDQLIHPLNHVTLATVQGEFRVVSVCPIDIPYSSPPILHNSTRAIQLSELIHINFAGSTNSNLVSWQDQLFVYKKASEDNINQILEEIQILDSLKEAPNIVELVGIVIHEGELRGFLTPYMRCRSLVNVFSNARITRNLAESDEGGTQLIEWILKLSWARQITQGVISLHKISAYNRRFNLAKVLIDGTGQAVLFSSSHYGPGDNSSFNRNSESDNIVLLGQLLWSVANEAQLWDPLDVSNWREDAAPGWYRRIVEKCVANDLAERPTAIEVYGMLSKDY